MSLLLVFYLFSKTIIFMSWRYNNLRQASRALVLLFLRDFQNNASQHRVLVLSDDCNERYYPFWASRMIDIKEEPGDVDKMAFSDPVQLDKLIADVCIGLLRIGQNLSTLSKADAKKGFEEFADRYRKELPNPSLVGALSSCVGIMSIDDWLEIYQEHFKLVLESGKMH